MEWLFGFCSLAGGSEVIGTLHKEVMELVLGMLINVEEGDDEFLSGDKHVSKSPPPSIVDKSWSKESMNSNSSVKTGLSKPCDVFQKLVNFVLGIIKKVLIDLVNLYMQNLQMK